MKKFKIIRNLLIILIILIALSYVLFIRSKNVTKSKTYQTFENINYYKQNKQVTMQMEYESNQLSILWIYATDFENEKEVCIQDINFKERNDSGIHIWITGNEGTRHIAIDKQNKTYRDDGIVDDTTFENVNYWFNNMILTQILNSKYYTKGYEQVDGELLYCETFKEAGAKFYYKKGNLEYIKMDTFKDSFDGMIKDGRLKVKLTFDNAYEEETKIPEGYTEQTSFPVTTIDENGNKTVEYATREELEKE